MPIVDVIKERGKEFLRDTRITVYLWALSVHIETIIDSEIKEELNAILNSDEFTYVVFSVSPHTGDADSFIIKRGLERAFPQLRGKIQFVADEERWGTPEAQAEADKTVGQLLLFDRKNKSVHYLPNAQKRMAGILLENKACMVVYSPGTRDEESQAEKNFAPSFMNSVQQNNNIRSVGIPIDLRGTKDVLPKVPEDQEAMQKAEKWRSRLKNIFRGAEHRATLVVGNLVKGYIEIRGSDHGFRSRGKILTSMKEETEKVKNLKLDTQNQTSHELHGWNN